VYCLKAGFFSIIQNVVISASIVCWVTLDGIISYWFWVD